MKFVEKIRKRLGVSTRYSMAVDVLKTSPQHYESLVKSKDRIRYVDLMKLRKVSGLTDTQLLDLIAGEVESIERQRKKGSV